MSDKMPEITDQAICDRFVEALLLHAGRGEKCRFYQKYGLSPMRYRVDLHFFGMYPLMFLNV
ncbi:MAG: hypothetical protein LBP56_10985 [Odoribacteraceae bacterium]|jgi:hypothetical protein|nr:hypothetical protein [Odoribacteraceae bacterium]